jgi:hypothetical protein
MKTVLALILALPLATQAAVIFTDGFGGQAQGTDRRPANWFIEGGSARPTLHNVSWLATPETSLLLGSGMFASDCCFARGAPRPQITQRELRIH